MQLKKVSGNNRQVWGGLWSKHLQNLSGDFVDRGIVPFTNEKSATKVIKLCNGTDFMGRKMVVDRAVSQLPKESNTNVMLKTKDEPGEHVALKEK
jgi:RNA recognition motif-containing protein